MTHGEQIAKEFEQEAATTRRVLERMPEDKLDWRPHEKSWTLGELATHIANLPSWTHATLAMDEFDVNPPDGGEFKTPTPETKEGILELFDRNVNAASDQMKGLSDAGYHELWTFKDGGQVLFSAPKESVVRSFIFRHWAHHRGQMTVYLRLNDVPVPQIYGPTADEPDF